MAVKEEDKPIAKPTAAEGLKYTGKEQVGVYTVTANLYCPGELNT